MGAVIVALVGVVVAFLQERIVRAQRRLSEAQFVRSLNDDWRALKAQWEIALMVARADDDYYVNVPYEVQLRYRALKAADEAYYGSAVEDVVGVGVWAPSSDTGEDMAAPDTGDDATEGPPDPPREAIVLELRQFEYCIRDVIDFLAEAAGRVLAGDVRLATVYEAVGVSLLNNASPVRTMLTQEYRYEYLIPGHRQRVLALMDLLWAHAVRVCDVPIEDARALAKHKRITGSGLHNRLRVRRLARIHSGRVRAMRLEYTLLFAEEGRRARGIRRGARLLRGMLAA